MAVNIWKSYVCTALKETNIELILAVMNTTELVVEIGPEKNSDPFGIWTHDLCDTALRKWGETLDYVLYFSLHFFRALAASSVLYNSTEHSQGLSIC